MKIATEIPLLETRGLTKSYAGHVVLDSASVSVARGEVVSVIGENGAGKSTFAKIVTGVAMPDAGGVYLDGHLLDMRSPRDALRHGIALIPQELAYAPHLTVGENIALGRWPRRFGFTSASRTLRQSQRECDRFGIPLDVRRPMSRTKLAERQLVEIVKALGREDRLIVLDEPTSSLSELESERLFDVLRTMTANGAGVLYISHRMDEVTRISDRVVVFRNGVVVAENPARTTTQATLIEQMLGGLKDSFEAGAAVSDAHPVLVSLRSWSSDGTPPLREVDVQVRTHEVLGLYGLRGSGVEVVAEGLGGLRRDIAGRLTVGGADVPIPDAPRRSLALGIAYLPPERKRDGLVLGMSIQANLTLTIIERLSRAGVIRPARERDQARRSSRAFDVRMRRLEQPVRQLSGGNQQKVLLASRTALEPRCLVLHEPTRGVDIGARVEIHGFLRALAAGGGAVVVVTSDVDEAVAVSDRLLILRDGRLVAELSGADKTRGAAVAAAAGGAA